MTPQEIREQVDSWLSILDHSTYYELLGILEIASESAIQDAFHKFSESFHPDRHRGQSDELRTAVTHIYRRGAEAYGVLRDPLKRAAYDVAMNQGQLRWNPGQTVEGAPAQLSDLASLCKTKAGALHARQAERAITEKDWNSGSALLRKALLAEGGNRELEKRSAELIDLVKNTFP